MRKLMTLMLLCGLSLTAGATATQRDTTSKRRPAQHHSDHGGRSGYETIAANGGTSYKTPNIDRLAANGMRFENATRIRSAHLRASP